MKELFSEKEMKTTEKNKEPLAKFPGYTSEEYLDDVLDFFYSGKYNREVYTDFKHIYERSMQKDSKVKFIKEIEKYNFNIFEIYVLLYLAIFKIKKHGIRKSDLIERLIEKHLAKPSVIVKILSENSKLFKSKCIICEKNNPYEEGNLEIDDNLFNILVNTDFEENKETKKEDKKERKFNIIPNEIYTELNKYVIGQDNATKSITAAVYEHIIKCEINKKTDSKDKLDKTNTLIIGPTGTGKTFICNTLSKILNIPIYVADASQMTESGYIGLSPESILIGLEKMCGESLKDNKFPVSIIYVDEIDKIAFKKTDKYDVGNKGVQEEFLKMFESNKYFFDGGRGYRSREYDISNIMFILGGAFSGLEKIIEERTKSNEEKKIGFFKENVSLQEDKTNILQQTTTEDLVEYGLMPELVGRLPNKVILNPLTKQDLINILTVSQNNVISQYKQVFSEAGIKLNVLDETIEAVAYRAIENNTGARGLKTILSNILNKILFEAVSNGQKDFVLTPEKLSAY